MEKILFISPHLSTGGLPQFLLKKIELLKNEYEIHLVEYSNITGGKFVVQRDKITSILGDRFYSLIDPVSELPNILDTVMPDIIHLEEIPEFFMDEKIGDYIYRANRNYKIFETSHDSSFDSNLKRYLPDKFLFVSKYQLDLYRHLGVDSEVIEYPIDYKSNKMDRNDACELLGIDPDFKHVLHVGLFTPRKNQKEFFEFARSLPEYQFHCVGNQAENFQYYWEPLMRNKPDNLTVWGERSDVDIFYQASDLFLFTSKGDSSDKETMPLVIRESISWDIPTLIYNLPVYQSYFDSFPSVDYLDNEFDKNILSIKNKLTVTQKNTNQPKTCVIVDTFITSPDKEELLIENLKTIRNFGHDIILVSHSNLSKNALDLVDYFLYDRDNSFNDNHVYSWRKDAGVEIRINIRKSHEWPIIRSMRLAFNTAKSLGYEYFIFTEFDHKYSDSDISRVKNIISSSISSDKDFVFWAPQERVDYGGYGNETGIFYETCFFSGFIGEFISVFEDSFPKTLEEYNTHFASQFPNSLEFWFWKFFSPLSERSTVIPNYVKLDLSSSEINVSSYQNFKSVILPGPESHYLYITNENFVNYEFEVYFDDKPEEYFDLNRYYKLIRLDKDCKIRIDAFSEGLKFSTETIFYKKELSSEYEKNGIIIFPENKEPSLFNIGFDPAENKVLIDYQGSERREVHVSIKDIDSLATIWSFKNVAENGSKWWCIPTPKAVLDYENQINFGGILVEIYERGKLIFTGDHRIKKPFVFKPQMDITISEPIFSNYNEFFVDKIYSHLDAQSLRTVFDIGANVGLWTEWILRQNASKVYCFEPNRIALDVLRKFHGDKDNVEIIDKALDIENKTIEFYYSDSNSLISATEKHSELDKSYQVQTVTLDEIISKYSIDHIDLIKMDIEGAEFRIFENLSDDIYNITDSFLIEFHAFYYNDGKEREQKIRDKLSDMGYFIEDHPGGIFATKYKKCFYVNNSSFALDVPGKGTIEKVNLYNDSFSWEALAKKRLVGYHHAYNEIFSQSGCVYENEECRISKGDVVVDIGSNIGIFTHYAYRKGASEIYSFEPSTESFECLSLNTSNISNNFKIALDDKIGSAKLFCKQGDTMCSSLKNETEKSELVIVETIDSLFEKKVFERIDFLKIDAEGSEVGIIKGAEKMLTDGMISKISIEMHPNIVGEEEISIMCERMIGKGYNYSSRKTDENIIFYYFWLP
jgi:FkbM family methyltransferase